tara:strand:+ start:6 stop:533 length:528 start_codon:yes stop_codon:yes gene_type:complete
VRYWLRYYEKSRLVELERPSALNYVISSVLYEEGMTDRENFEKHLNIYHGVDANFEFESWGKVKYPKQFDSLKCSFLVNPQAGSEYIKYASKGYIGDGWLENNRFLFRLYLAPDVARNLIEKEDLSRKLTSIGDGYDSKPDSDNCWLTIQLDLIDYRHLENYGDKVWFNIVRVYI